MPVYEYGCPACRKQRSIFFRTLAAVEANPACPECGGRHLVKLVSRVAVKKSEDARMEAMADVAGFGDVDEGDPRSVARWARKMGGALGDDLGEDFDEMVDQVGEGGPEGGPGGGAEDWSPAGY